jgi:hypothetical protein
MTASEQLAELIVADATGEDLSVVEAIIDGAPVPRGVVVGIDPASLGMILDLVLGFITGLVDKLREGGLCLREVTVGNTQTGEEEKLLLALSEEQRADRVIAVLRSPRRRQRARVYAELRDVLRGTPADPYDHMASTFRIAGNPANEELVRQVIHEGEAPDYGWT